jgi:predicted metal-dependent phosphoesterase TrpH
LIDLHTHTTASDGTFTPRDLVYKAKEEGLDAIAITDHDTMAGNAEALEIGKQLEFEVISGVEISADCPFGSQHIVGLFIDPQNETLESVLHELREFREQRNRKMIVRLAELDIHITMDELLAEAGGDLVGRPHFARLLEKRGYVTNYREAFEKYLKAGGAAYLDKKRLPSDQAIQMIHEAGGTSILAHPYVLRQKDQANFEENVAYLVDQGIQGIEAYYSDHTKGDEALFTDLARRHNLLVSGGTDFHGAVKPDIQLGRGFGSMNIPYDVLQVLKEARS